MVEYFRDLVATPLPNPDPYGRASRQMNVGDVLYSATRAFRLTLEPNGNLVEYVIDYSAVPIDITKAEYTQVVWASATEGTGAVRLNMETDGGLVLYRADGAPVWSVPTAVVGSFLRCQDDGNLVIYLKNGVAIASSNVYAA